MRSHSLILRSLNLVLILVLLLPGSTLPPANAFSPPVKVASQKTVQIDVTVTITGSGFNPTLVQITVGQTVGWRNDTGHAQTITTEAAQYIYLPLVKTVEKAASPVAAFQQNPAGFLQQQQGESFTATIQPGETWSHTFSEVGTVNYHSVGSPIIQGKVVVSIPDVPPDPRKLAPTVEPGVVTDFSRSVSFLYEGPVPVQYGVQPGEIKANNVAVLRGRVVDQNGKPISGVDVFILDHPEYGLTRTRTDGAFDMAVNGGAQLTVQYQKSGYLTLQRDTDPNRIDFSWLSDVTLLKSDAPLIPVKVGVGSSAQIAQGSVETDTDGTRKAALLFPAGVEASAALSDGSLVSANDLSVQISEYTVGASGPDAMPGELPATSAYTYAFEMSVWVNGLNGQEADGLGFSRPLVNYTENFLNFPVGSVVPLGYYDRAQSNWVPAENGRVIKILSVTNGLANLDVDGTGQPANASALAGLGIDAAEQQKLASQYAVGKSLWRIRIVGVGEAVAVQRAVIAARAQELIDNAMQLASLTLPQPPGKVDAQARGKAGQQEAVELLSDAASIPQMTETPTPASINKDGVNVPAGAGTSTPTMTVTRTPTKTFTKTPKPTKTPTPTGSATVTYTVTVTNTPTKTGTPTETPTETETTLVTVTPTPSRTAIKTQTRTSTLLPTTTLTATPSPTPQPTPNFSVPWDCNWPYTPPDDAQWPDQTPPKKPGDNCKQEGGSIIGCQDQTLGEELSIQGTSFNLHYQTDRSSGYLLGRTVEVPLTGDTIPASLKRVTLQIFVAGQEHDFEFPAAANQSTSYTWDGLDAYGREVNGMFPATVVIGYVYQAVYRAPSSGSSGSSFASSAPSGSIIGDKARQEVTLIQKWQTQVGIWHADVVGLGGWSLDAQHVYDRSQNMLFMGDGRNISVDAMGSIIQSIAGANPNKDCWALDNCGDGGPASEARLDDPSAIAFGPDGSLYIAEVGLWAYGSDAHIRKIDPNGIITQIAGNGIYCGQPICGDGLPANQAFLLYPNDIVVGPDGSIYIADSGSNAVRKITPDGIIHTIAGTGVEGINPIPDGTPAQEANIAPYKLALGPDGSLYIAGEPENTVLRMSPDGKLTNFAGGGNCDDETCDGKPANQISFGVESMDVGPDGSLYIASGTSLVWRITPDGIAHIIAGNGNWCPFDPDHCVGGLKPRDTALYYMQGLSVAKDGTVYIADGYMVWELTPSGEMEMVVGKWDEEASSYGGGSCSYYPGQEDCGDGGPAGAARLTWAQDVAMGPEGYVYLLDSYCSNYGCDFSRIRRMTPYNGWTISDHALIPSDDAQQVFEFSGSGQHLKTLDLKTGAVIFTFSYDSQGRLAQIEDAYGGKTSIERDANGLPTAFVAPGGQRTELHLNTNGYIDRVTYPGGAAYNFTYTSTGLMTGEVDSNGGHHVFSYASDGSLVSDTGPLGGTTTLERVKANGVDTVTVTDPVGRKTVFTSQSLSDGSIKTTQHSSDGSTLEAITGLDGTQQITYSDGMVVTQKLGKHPVWGTGSPVLLERSVSLPGGLVSEEKYTYTGTLAQPFDPFSLVELSTTATVNGQVFTSKYDAATRILTYTTATGRQIVTTYDAFGRVASISKGASLAPMVFTYDNRGQIASITMGDQVISYTYNTAGQVTERSYSGGPAQQFTYNSAGDVSQMTMPGAQVYAYTYDANGNLTGLTTPGGSQYTLTYAANNLWDSYTAPGMNAPLQTTFNAAGNIDSVTLPSGRKLTSGFDSSGRLTTWTYPEAVETFSLNDVGQVTGLSRAPTGSEPAQSLTFSYLGDRVSNLSFTGAANGTYQYQYNNDLLVSSIQLDAMPADTLSYDADGNLTAYGPFTITRGGPDGLPSQYNSNVLHVTLAYDNQGRVTSRIYTVNGTGVATLTFAYDNHGYLASRTESFGGTIHTYTFNYDANGQLKTVEKDGSGYESYTYDDRGNRLSSTLSGSVENTTFNSQDQPIQVASIAYSYDADGYLKTRGSDSFTYSTRGELLKAVSGGQTIYYSYDGFSRLTARITTTGTEQFLYGNPSQVFQVTATRAPSGELTQYYYDEEGKLYAFVRGGLWYTVVTDQAGTPRRVYDANGQVVKALEYNAYGRLISDSAPSFYLPIGYTGGLVDPVTGLVRLGFRDYDPRTGSFTARDPVLFDSGTADLYAYVGGNPVSRTDPSGLWCIGASGGVLVGGEVKFCYKSGEGWSLCEGVGLVAGFSAEIEPTGDVEPRGGFVAAEVGANAGPLSLTVGAKVNACDNESKVKFCAGAPCAEVDLHTGEFKIKFEKGEETHVKNISQLGKFGKIGLSAKVLGGDCYTKRY